jgi:hypothetical protein
MNRLASLLRTDDPPRECTSQTYEVPLVTFQHAAAWVEELKNVIRRRAYDGGDRCRLLQWRRGWAPFYKTALFPFRKVIDSSDHERHQQ